MDNSLVDACFDRNGLPHFKPTKVFMDALRESGPITIERAINELEKRRDAWAESGREIWASRINDHIICIQLYESETK